MATPQYEADHDDSQPQGLTTRVTLPRVALALAELGYDPLEREDRLVIGLPGYILTCWMEPQLPASLHLDGQLRVPLPLAESSKLTRILNTYNGQSPGPVASYRVTDAGTLAVRMRAGTFISDGLSEDQLHNWLRTLIDATEHLVHELDRLFPEADIFAPLPEPLRAEQDYAQLSGKHPKWRHRAETPRRTWTPELDEFTYTDEDLAKQARLRPKWLTEQMLRDAVGGLGFVYGIREDNVLLLTINGMSISVESLIGQWVRVYGIWFTALPSKEHATNLALLCNEANDRTLMEGCSVFSDAEHAIVVISSHLLIDAGVSPAQLFTFIQYANRYHMDMLDYISTQATGECCIDWPQEYPDDPPR